MRSAATFYSLQAVAFKGGQYYLADTYNQTIRAGIVLGKSLAQVSLGNLSATYDGTAHAVTATTNPSGLSVTVTYNGSATAPTNAGSYSVVATVNDPNFQGSASGTLVIGKATATVTLGGLAASYDGTAKSAAATTSPSGLSVTVTYNGSAIAPTNVGSYAVAATINDPNYSGTASGTLVIAKGTATVTLGNLSGTYNGGGHFATATTVPVGLSVSFTYNGLTTLPVAVGSYAVVGTVNNATYAGTATGTLVISPGVATVTFGNLTFTYNGAAHPATATTVPAGLNVTFTYNGSATVPINVGSYTVVATVNNANYTGSATSTLVINKPAAAVTLGSSGGHLQWRGACGDGDDKSGGTERHLHLQW